MYFDIVLLNEKCTKCIYQHLNNNYLVPTVSARWNNELSAYEQVFSTYHCIVKICFKTTTDSFLLRGYNIEFHIEFFLLIFLKKIKAITDDCCNFCKEKSETIQHVFLFVCLKFIVPLENQHVFISCMHSLPVWSKLSMHILETLEKE